MRLNTLIFINSSVGALKYPWIAKTPLLGGITVKELVPRKQVSRMALQSQYSNNNTVRIFLLFTSLFLPIFNSTFAQNTASTAKASEPTRLSGSPIVGSSAVISSISDFFKIDLVKFHQKEPDDRICVWKNPGRANLRKGTTSFSPCLEVKVSVKENIRSDTTFAKAYFYGEDNKIIESLQTPSKSGLPGTVKASQVQSPVLFYKDQLNRFFFEVPDEIAKVKWKAVIVFGDENETQVATYPPTISAFHLDYPERRLVEDKSAKRIARKPAMDPLIEHVVRTQNPKMPQITLFLRPPKGITDATHIQGVLAVCILANGLEEMKRELTKEEMSGDYDGLFSFANKHKLAILAWGSKRLWDPGKNYDDLPKEKAKEIDVSLDTVSTAWARGVQELGEKYGIPQRNFLLWGNCGAGQWAQRLCLRKPEYFLAVYIHQPGSYDKPTPEAAKVLWCLTIGELYGGYERSKQWVNMVRDMGYPIIYKAIPDLGHHTHPDATALGFAFLDFALQQKEKRIALDTALQKNISNASIEKPASPWLKEFNSPAFWGDMVNQEVFPADQVSMIPKGYRIPLPTKEIADIWMKDQ